MNKELCIKVVNEIIILLVYFIINSQQYPALSGLFIYCTITLHVSCALCTHHQEYIKLQLQPLVRKSMCWCDVDLKSFKRCPRSAVYLTMSWPDQNSVNKRLLKAATCWLFMIKQICDGRNYKHKKKFQRNIL